MTPTTAEKITVVCDVVSLFNICLAAYFIRKARRLGKETEALVERRNIELLEALGRRDSLRSAGKP